MAITDFPLIAVTEVLDMASVDNSVPLYDGSGNWAFGPCHELMERKLDEVEEWYSWSRDEEFRNPIYIYSPTYRNNIRLRDGGEVDRLIGNGHHRLFFQAHVQGALFVHYSDNPYASD